MKYLILPLALLLTSCGINRINTKDVNIPVLMKCVPDDIRVKPVYPDTDEALRFAAGPGERALLLFAGREIRIARLAELETVIEKCP